LSFLLPFVSCHGLSGVSFILLRGVINLRDGKIKGLAGRPTFQNPSFAKQITAI
jgi:hypothetical protein